ACFMTISFLLRLGQFHPEAGSPGRILSLGVTPAFDARGQFPRHSPMHLEQRVRGQPKPTYHFALNPEPQQHGPNPSVPPSLDGVTKQPVRPDPRLQSKRSAPTDNGGTSTQAGNVSAGVPRGRNSAGPGDGCKPQESNDETQKAHRNQLARCVDR